MNRPTLWGQSKIRGFFTQIHIRLLDCLTLNTTELVYVDAKRLKVLGSWLLTSAHSSRSTNGTTELRECTTETIIEAGKHYSLHHGHFVGPCP